MTIALSRYGGDLGNADDRALHGRAPAQSAVVVVALLIAAAGCGSGSRPPADGGQALDGGADGGTVAMANIKEALNCGTPAGVTGTGRAGELQLREVDTTVFPDALCNDGTPAVIYYRPYRGEANRNRWVVSLRGGGSCGGAGSCAARWCSCSTAQRCPFAASTTNFNLNNMSGGGGRSRSGTGVMLRDGPLPNPLQDYNHVQLIYCSSDSWRGAVRGVTYSTTHPITGQEVSYSLHFLGARILDAGLRILRQDGVSPLVYTLDGSDTPMPDLDAAVEVVIVGDSAGGAGVIHNLDYIAATLRAQHQDCDGGVSCAPEVFGVIDAIVGPELSRLDWSMSVGVDAGIDSYEKYVNAGAAAASNAGARTDTSCRGWHVANRPGTEGECGDAMHVIRNHITTPFFVRMALLDRLISGSYEESGLADPDLGPFVDNAMGIPVVFATVLQRELKDLPMLGSTAEEKADIRVAPGVFAPSCANHDTIHENTEVYGVTINPTGAIAYRFFDVYRAWRDGGAPSAVLSSDPTRADTSCP